MAIKFKLLIRKIHFWAAITIVLPLSLVICTGMLLLLKNDFSWIQPPTQKAQPYTLNLTFAEIIQHAAQAPQANIHTWQDIDRLDIRPQNGTITVRSTNRWEVQLSAQDGHVLSVMRRNSDLIKSLHDGTWFHKNVKYWVFLPSATVLLLMLLTGMYLFITTLASRRRAKKAVAQARTK